MLNLMYITNNSEIAKIAENSGVQRIFIDMEYIGKSDRQGGMDTVQSHHTIADIVKMKSILKTAQVLARCNPIHKATKEFMSSEDEINGAIEAGADILMLPYFKTPAEVEEFIKLVNGRVRTMLLIETPESVDCIDEILSIKGIDEVFVGLNDLSLGYGMKFMFELLSNGTVEMLCNKFKQKGIPYGFGGIASLGEGLLIAERVIAEHYRLGSTCAILSRSFCNASKVSNMQALNFSFRDKLNKIREWEKKCENGQVDFLENKKQVKIAVQQILEK